MRFSVILILVAPLLVVGSGIDQVDDADLIHLLTGEENVITLFTKDNCPDCEEWTAVVENIKTDLKDNLDAVVVKAHNSNLVSIYDPSKEPSLVFFRKGIPLLYFGERKEEDVVNFFVYNREPNVKELSDANFEHLTQASTGATTGDWFIFFYSVDCVLCQRLYAVWESVGAELKQRLSVARVNRLEGGHSTAKRFGITESPEFILLRKGKIYRYKQKVYTTKSFTDFARVGYQKQLQPETVSPPPDALNEFYEGYLRPYVENRSFILGSAIFSFALIAIIFASRLMKQQKKTDKKNKKSK